MGRKLEVLYFEKKSQKTLIRWLPTKLTQVTPGGEGARAKVFWFFFSKKNTS
jgi:hypothetical protein